MHEEELQDVRSHGAFVRTVPPAMKITSLFNNSFTVLFRSHTVEEQKEETEKYLPYDNWLLQTASARSNSKRSSFDACRKLLVTKT